MVFGAGIGIGMLTFATAEPMYHFAANSSTIMGLTEGSTAGNVRDAYVWSFTHWGLAAWAAYAIVGLALAYFCYRRGLPRIVFGDWLYTVAADGTRSSSTLGIPFALLVIIGASTLSALSGVGKGIKWLSNINMGLSFFVLFFFLVFGSTFFGLSAFFVGIWDYLLSIPGNLFTVWPADGTEQGDALAGWQGGWTIFYWAWWIAFAPFVGVFLARISKGRTIREYVLGALIIPAAMCFIWFALVGGTAIDLELSGVANGAIAGAGPSDQLFAVLAVILNETLAYLMSVIVVVLLLTYLVTSADSAVLIINTINAAGDEGPKARPHILFWGAALSLVVGGLILAGGLGTIRTAMVIGALPFSFVMLLMGLSLIRAVYRDGLREKHGLPTTHVEPTSAEPAASKD